MRRISTRFGTQVTRKWTTTKWFAARREIEYALPRELAEDLIVGNCHYCGVPAQNVGSAATLLSDGQPSQTGLNGIDRIDSDGGYVVDNVVSCCSTCNAAKGELTVTEFRSWIERVYNHQKLNS